MKIAAGNWKMNLGLAEGIKLAEDIAKGSIPSDVQVILATPALHLASAHEVCNSNDNLHLAAQNCHSEPSGAYTGELSAEMIASTGATHVIIGHSERRAYFEEEDDFLLAKTRAVLRAGLQPIFCCGEPLEIREEGKQENLVKQQLSNTILTLSEEELSQIIIAYEPVWAIGTGKTASPEQAQEMHAFIRSTITDKFGEATAQSIPILYGGSVKPQNAKEIFAQKDVNGGLVGGASLKAHDFLTIINAF